MAAVLSACLGTVTPEIRTQMTVATSRACSSDGSAVPRGTGLGWFTTRGRDLRARGVSVLQLTDWLALQNEDGNGEKFLWEQKVESRDLRRDEAWMSGLPALRLRGGIKVQLPWEEEEDEDRALRSPVIGIPRDFPNIASAVEEAMTRRLSGLYGETTIVDLCPGSHLIPRKWRVVYRSKDMWQYHKVRLSMHASGTRASTRACANTETQNHPVTPLPQRPPLLSLHRHMYTRIPLKHNTCSPTQYRNG